MTGDRMNRLSVYSGGRCRKWVHKKWVHKIKKPLQSQMTAGATILVSRYHPNCLLNTITRVRVAISNDNSDFSKFHVIHSAAPSLGSCKRYFSLSQPSRDSLSIRLYTTLLFSAFRLTCKMQFSCNNYTFYTTPCQFKFPFLRLLAFPVKMV